MVLKVQSITAEPFLLEKISSLKKELSVQSRCSLEESENQRVP